MHYFVALKRLLAHFLIELQVKWDDVFRNSSKCCACALRLGPALLSRPEPCWSWDIEEMWCVSIINSWFWKLLKEVIKCGIEEKWNYIHLTFPSSLDKLMEWVKFSLLYWERCQVFFYTLTLAKGYYNWDMKKRWRRCK